jgi:hypothetical protein
VQKGFCNNIGTLRPMACLVECPQLPKADIERGNPKSQFDPEQTSGVQCNSCNLGTELEPPAHTLREGQQQQIIHLNGRAAWTLANNFMQKCDLLLPAAMNFQRCWVLLLAMAAIILGSKFWLISVFGSPTPFEDQWDAEAAWLFKPYVEGTLRIGDLLAPHNEHRCL